LYKIVAILKADVKDFSKISEHKLRDFDKKFSEIKEKVLIGRDYFFQPQSQGDDFIVASYDYMSIVKIALDLHREFLSQSNWKEYNLPNMTIRIALDINRLQEKDATDTNMEIGVIGGMTKVARIEPIVEPNHIYMSQVFYCFLQEEKNLDLNIEYKDLGETKLDKNYGKSRLYEIIPKSENNILDKKIIYSNSSNKHNYLFGTIKDNYKLYHKFGFINSQEKNKDVHFSSNIIENTSFFKEVKAGKLVCFIKGLDKINKPTATSIVPLEVRLTGRIDSDFENGKSFIVIAIKDSNITALANKKDFSFIIEKGFKISFLLEMSSKRNNIFAKQISKI